jgi:DNA replication protein DnaC
LLGSAPTSRQIPPACRTSSSCNKVFPDPAMTLAAIDRRVHHATIVEMNVESYRRRAALERKRGPGRPPAHATPKTVAD